MTTTTTAELLAVSGTDMITLPPAARAAVALRSEQTRKDLALLVEQSTSITAVLNADGREQAHRVAMTLKGARVAIEKTGKEARDDATKFSKAVIAEEKDLIAIIEPEEARILALRDAWDAQVAAEKAAKIAAERARVEAIQRDIQSIRDIPAGLVLKDSGAIATAIDALRQIEATDERFAEFKDIAAKAIDETDHALVQMHGATKQAELAAVAADEARKAEVARIEAERAELAQLRAAAAETARLVKIESDRIAAEQAAEAKRLADERRQQEAELQRQRDAEAARVRAEQEARDAAAAEVSRVLAAQQAELDAKFAAFEREKQEVAERIEVAAQLERDHAEALLLDAAFDHERELDREAERVRLQTSANQHLADARLPPPESLTEADALIDAGGQIDIADRDIIDLICATFDLSPLEAVDRLELIDFAAARAEHEVAA